MSDAASMGSRQYLTTRAIFSDRNADPPASRRTLLPSDGPVRFSGAPAALADEILEQHHCPARHFPKFGADAYVVDMVGILVLREIGVLIVSIMVAGRSGSAYTAELGSMKMREEIDALRTMGFNPIDVLVLPRVIALLCALPVLAFMGSMAALYGGGLVAWLYGGMSPAIFIARLREAISITHFEVGMIKAPFMALAIGIVACSEGLRVKGSAESLGLQTTTSVVKSIFLVIVLDGVFAMFFASIGV